MIVQGRDLARGVTETADVCVVGSGAGGAVVAWELSERGHSVVLLEKGGYHTREQMTQKEDEMMPKLYMNGGFLFSLPSGIAVAQGRCVGGSTVINDAVCFRAPDPVLGWWEDDYKVEGVSPADLKPYFERVEKRISVSEVRPDELNKNNLVLKRGAEKLGWEAGPNRRNCRDCRQCGFCQMGCYYGTKQSMLETYIPDTQRFHGDLVKIYSDCEAQKVVTSGGRAIGVSATSTGEGGRAHKVDVKAKVTVVSAGTIASSALLLQSGINPGGRVGKRVALHPSPAVVGDFEEEIDGHRGIPMAYHCTEFSVLKTGKRGFMIESVFLAPLQFSLPIPGVDYDYKELMSRYNHYALLGSLLHDEMVGSVTVGGPLSPTLNYQISAGDSKTLLEGMKASARILFAAGATKVITSHRKKTVLYGDDDLHLIDEMGAAPLGMSIGSGHPQGGNPMGGDSSKAVVDSHSKFYGLGGLFVCDASVFPTSLGVNPQVTVMALGARAGDYIGENWGSLAGGTG
jgi:choline dehydrogenase-like flavoprotein